MTSPIAIRGIEQWNRWSTDHSPLLESEDSEGRKSRMLRGGIRLQPVVKYWFIFLALGLLLTDSFRLAFSANTSQAVSSTTRTTRNAPTVRGVSHAPKTTAKRHSGV
jgi:hypothetical protein